MGAIVTTGAAAVTAPIVAAVLGIGAVVTGVTMTKEKVRRKMQNDFRFGQRRPNKDRRDQMKWEWENENFAHLNVISPRY